MTRPTPEQVDAGKAVYSKAVLALYDTLVLGLTNHLVWRCPTSRLLDLYNSQVSGNHLEVGVGTGYFLDRCQFPTPQPRLVLLDLNPNCLDLTGRRVSRYHPRIVVHNLLEPIPYQGDGFGSVGMNYVLHCLPGPMHEKAIVFDHLRSLVRPGGTIFGATLLSEGVRRGFLARRLMQAYNARGIFSNSLDRLDELQEALSTRFEVSTVQVVGCAALFFARV
ncbi:MAG: class I SAM-dependent methyltransferase [Isosphaeraceae bacterium]